MRSAGSVEWHRVAGLIHYADGVGLMDRAVALCSDPWAPHWVDRCWLLEHHPVYTEGTGSVREHRGMLGGVPIVTTGRGGKITFHGPGQRVVYMTIALERRYGMIDLHRFLRDLEQWVIGCLGHWGIRSFTMPGMTGVWLEDARGQHRKICAIGIRARRGIVTHGIALNVHPDLRYFDRIVPCGIQGYGVTSLHAEGYELSMEEVDRVLQMPSLMFQ